MGEEFVRARTDDGKFDIEQVPDGHWFTVVNVLGGQYYFDAATRDDLIAKVADFRKIKYRDPEYDECRGVRWRRPALGAEGGAS